MWVWVGCAAAFITVAVAVLFIFIKSASNVSVCLEDTVGEKCKVIETVDNYAGSGLVRVKGTEWSARCVDDDDIFEVGEVLTVVAIEGARLVCKK